MARVHTLEANLNLFYEWIVTNYVYQILIMHESLSDIPNDCSNKLNSKDSYEK